MPHVSIVIPVYRNLSDFALYLEHNRQFFGASEVIIVNDDPQSHLPQDMPSDKLSDSRLKWINHTENQGFSISVNEGVQRSNGEFLLLLNTDVKLRDASWQSALEAFAGNSQLFAVSFAQKERNGAVVGRNEVYFKDGLFHHRALAFEPTKVAQGNELLPTAWAEGGSALFRRSMWDRLGGFDVAYSPFYWEDVDLSYRAKLSGWQVLFAPNVVVEHHHESTIGKEFEKQ
ncbi:glycosyltransferase family 2 protein, partial [Candidatus Woesebacteria bacterium]|nr:glycosyltransferase family 2 protein [Candidatus Woesebacteria bacterium]